MAIPRATWGMLLVACFALFSALIVATRLTRSSSREMTAPEAWAALERREPERAASIFKAELIERPNDPVLHFGAGAAAYAMGRTDAALSSLQHAVEIDPEFPEALALLGEVAYARGKNDLAIRSMERAAAMRPRDTRVAELLDRWRRETSVHSVYVEKPSGHFRILYEGPAQQSIGDRIARVLEAEYSRLGRTLNSFPTEPITVVLYTNREFQDLTRSPSWATGHYDGRIRVAVGGTLSRDLDRVVTHELVHAMVANAAPRRVPAWVNEGLATYLEGSDRAWTREVLRKAPALVPLDGLVQGFSGLDEERALVAYAESAIAAEILCAQLGSNIGAFLRSVGNGQSIDDALLEFQVQPNAFHSEWRRRVGLQ
ncbi:MAG TPA: tetratricopeptide repeat protein [Vicinamibacterales bacterium]|jgi:tetratricopeptide (TPR) repeat protein